MTFVEVRVELPSRPYSIHIGENALERLQALIPAQAQDQRAAVVADNTTAGLYGDRVVTALQGGGWDVELLMVPPGEASKTPDKAVELCGRLAQAGFDRSSTVFALGGGVIGDLAGFVAAIYMRGIPFVTLPTTLLAQVDSSVGGKVGVDLPQGKNLIGAFHQPQAVIIDPGVLGTLPFREFAAGLAEVVKHAVIADASLFELLSRQANKVTAREPGLLSEIVARNCRIKAGIVVQDPEERTGVRAILNYGHTIGHAIERGATGWEIRHGEAVALGMLVEARLAARLGLGQEAVATALESLLE
ncbi:MAG: 3-dehydroquinate synthase, partial [Candidatus Zipacnadales bacterium]